jgi:hypothetical protein
MPFTYPDRTVKAAHAFCEDSCMRKVALKIPRHADRVRARSATVAYDKAGSHAPIGAQNDAAGFVAILGKLRFSEQLAMSKMGEDDIGHPAPQVGQSARDSTPGSHLTSPG